MVYPGVREEVRQMASAGAGSAGVEVARGGVMNSPRYAGNGRRAGRLAALGAGVVVRKKAASAGAGWAGGYRVGGLAVIGAAGGAGGQVAQQRTRAGYGSLPRGKEEKEEAGSAVVSSAGGGAGFRGRAVVYPRVRERNGVGTFSRVMGWAGLLCFSPSSGGEEGSGERGYRVGGV